VPAEMQKLWKGKQTVSSTELRVTHLYI